MGNEYAIEHPVKLTVPCSHCGLPAPAPPADHPNQPTFCCNGCRGAYELIHGWGLEDYYALRDTLSPGGGLAVVGAGRYQELDDPSIMGRSAPHPVGDELLTCRLAVAGLHCGACAWLIERSARLVPGWQSARVRMNDHTLDVVFDPQQTKLSRIASTLDTLGYRVAPLADSDQADRAAAENRRLLIQIAIAGFCAANAMWVAVALYAGQFSGIAAEHALALRWAGVTLGVAAVVTAGRTFFQGAWASLRTRTPHMDLPVALGLGVGVIAGIVGAIRGAGDVYFDSIAVLVFLLLVGRWVQFRQQRRAAEAVGLLMRLAPRTATRIEEDGSERVVPTDVLRADDILRVQAGEGVPADGVVVKGRSLLDRALMTGESRPVAVDVGDQVDAGTANLESPLDIRVTAIGMDSRVGRLMKLVEEAATTRPPLVQLADRIGGWFVVVVILLAVLTLVLWWRSSPAVAAEHAVALLIVACPCALALATPLALAVALGRSAKQRILVRGGDVLERMARTGVIWFDKTGTLTQGRLVVGEMIGPDCDQALALAAAVEQGSRHPVAEGIRRKAESCGLSGRRAEDIKQSVAGGMSGFVDGKHVLVGNRDFILSAGVELDRAAIDSVEQIAAAGATPVMVAIERRWSATFAIEDELRDDAKSVIEKLQTSGWTIGILSGDHPQTVAAVANRLGIKQQAVEGGLAPESKLQRIQQSKQNSATVVMVGDGVNDAAALAAADVGVAVRGGAEASLEAAPVFLADGRLTGLADLVGASQQTVRVIKRNFILSLAYNVLAVILAMAGKIDPLVAAVLMPISSLTVLSMTLGSRTFVKAEEV